MYIGIYIIYVYIYIYIHTFYIYIYIFALSFQHRASKTLEIFYVIGALGASFVLMRCLWMAPG